MSKRMSVDGELREDLTSTQGVQLSPQHENPDTENKEDAEVKEVGVKEAEVEDAEVKEAEVEDVEVKEAEVEDIEVKEAEVKDIEVKEVEDEEIEIKEAAFEEAEVEEAAQKSLRLLSCRLSYKDVFLLTLSILLVLTTSLLLKTQKELHSGRKVMKQLESEKLQLQRSVMFPDLQHFLNNFCNQSTTMCSRCRDGWSYHSSRCILLSKEIQTWKNAREKCIEYGGDLAVVFNAEDQAFFTNMTIEFVEQKKPGQNFHSAWIGLQDSDEEGNFTWVNGKNLNSNQSYWSIYNPNNAKAAWDKKKEGQDCVVIIPPKQRRKNWINTWDDLHCRVKRHYLCETAPSMYIELSSCNKSIGRVYSNEG